MQFLTESAINYKYNIATVAGAFSVWVADKMEWFATSLPTIAAIAGLVLTIVMITSHIVTMIRANRQQREDSRKKEMEIEKLKLEIMLLENRLNNNNKEEQ